MEFTLGIHGFYVISAIIGQKRALNAGFHNGVFSLIRDPYRTDSKMPVLFRFVMVRNAAYKTSYSVVKNRVQSLEIDPEAYL